MTVILTITLSDADAARIRAAIPASQTPQEAVTNLLVQMVEEYEAIHPAPAPAPIAPTVT